MISNRLAARVALSCAVFAAITACSDNVGPTAKERTIAGASLTVGQGSAHAWVTLNAQNIPIALGVSMTDGAMLGLPQTPMAPSPSALMLSLPLPTEAKVTGFDHVSLDWNPLGHDPVQVYGAPHFDFHFYTVSDSAQKAILPSDPQFAAKAASFPAAQFIPLGYVPPPGVPAASTIPQMGLHWTDVASPELNGQAFSSTFIFGSYDGKFIFIEPMITKAFLESKPTKTVAVPQPAQWGKPGYYPNNYTVSYDATAKEYRVVLASLSAHQ